MADRPLAVVSVPGTGGYQHRSAFMHLAAVLRDDWVAWDIAATLDGERFPGTVGEFADCAKLLARS